MADCTPVIIPLPAGKHFEPTLPDNHTSVASYPYLEVISSLTYAAMGTHPDIATAVCSLSPFTTMFGCNHIDGLKHIMRYLQGTLGQGILYTMGGSGLVGYMDANWANNTTNHHLISGFTFVTNRAQPPCTDVPHFCAWTFPTHMDLFETMIECTATNHVIFS